jgi:hypothetical protein
VACPLCGHLESTLALEARDMLYGKPGSHGGGRRWRRDYVL